LEKRPQVVIANTGIGIRGWLEAAEGWGLGEQLRAVLASSYLITRGPKARGAVRAAGLTDAWSAPSESCQEVVEHLRERGLAGCTVALQLHGDSQPEHCAELRAACARGTALRARRAPGQSLFKAAQLRRNRPATSRR